MFGDYWGTSAWGLGPSIVGGGKLGSMERELASHQHSCTVAFDLYKVAVWSF